MFDVFFFVYEQFAFQKVWLGRRTSGEEKKYGYQYTLHLERVRGIEPLSSAWQAGVIPLYYTRTLEYLLFVAYPIETFRLIRNLT